MTWVLRCLQDKHWEAVEAGHINSAEPPDWLPPEWRDSWITACQHDAKPVVHRNAHGYCIRAIRAGKDAQGAPQEHDPPFVAAEENDNMTTSAAPGPKPQRRPSIVSFSAFDPATLPAREWMYGKHYQRGVVSLTVGTGGRGKTSLVLVEVIAMALCEALLGEQPTARFRAWALRRRRYE
jgi:hypothetical protein